MKPLITIILLAATMFATAAPSSADGRVRARVAYEESQSFEIDGRTFPVDNFPRIVGLARKRIPIQYLFNLKAAKLDDELFVLVNRATFDDGMMGRFNTPHLFRISGDDSIKLIARPEGRKPKGGGFPPWIGPEDWDLITEPSGDHLIVLVNQHMAFTVQRYNTAGIQQNTLCFRDKRSDFIEAAEFDSQGRLHVVLSIRHCDRQEPEDNTLLYQQQGLRPRSIKFEYVRIDNTGLITHDIPLNEIPFSFPEVNLLTEGEDSDCFTDWASLEFLPDDSVVARVIGEGLREYAYGIPGGSREVVLIGTYQLPDDNPIKRLYQSLVEQ